jgi:hypothetical protein
LLVVAYIAVQLCTQITILFWREFHYFGKCTMDNQTEENGQPVNGTALPALAGFTLKNRNGGTYSPGRLYSREKKREVKEAYFHLQQEMFPRPPSFRSVAIRAKVDKKYAGRVIREIHANGDITDPFVIREANRLAIVHRGPGSKMLAVADQILLLSLQAENPAWPLRSYVLELSNQQGKLVSESTISLWFLKAFDHRRSFRKPNLIPLDKYRVGNIARYIEFLKLKDLITDHLRFNFVDEKHIINKDTVPNKVRACPLTGRVDAIQVSGNFREA